MRVDALQVFAISVAAFVAAILLLVGVLSGVSLGTALARALIGWTLLGALGIGITFLVRWVLREPAVRRGAHFDAEA